MRCRIAELVQTAYAVGEATASGGRWKAWREHGHRVVVRHHATEMIAVDVATRQVEPLNPGWRSVTDKQGINQILRFERLGETYGSLFGIE